jgi:uncharacterized protein (TIGR03066 family)
MMHLRDSLRACAFILVLAGAAGADPTDDTLKQLVGQWELTRTIAGREVKGVMTFTSNFKVSMKVPSPKGEVTFAGTFKLLDANTIEVTYRDTDTTDKSKLKITGDVLELTDEKGKTQRLTRVK